MITCICKRLSLYLKKPIFELSKSQTILISPRVSQYRPKWYWKCSVNLKVLRTTSLTHTWEISLQKSRLLFETNSSAFTWYQMSDFFFRLGSIQACTLPTRAITTRDRGITSVSNKVLYCYNALGLDLKQRKLVGHCVPLIVSNFRKYFTPCLGHYTLDIFAHNIAIKSYSDRFKILSQGKLFKILTYLGLSFLRAYFGWSIEISC